MLTKKQRESLYAFRARNEHRVRKAVGGKVAPPERALVVFSGPDKGAKVEAATALARELGLELVRVDSSRFADQTIGETEKNLTRVFASAQESGTLLFIDEGDTLFGKRSDVRDAHDRYANVETNYLLQRLEDYSGLVILSTNNPAPQSLSSSARFTVKFGEDD